MNTATNTTGLSVSYRGVEGSNPRFAALNSSELVDSLRNRFPNWDVSHGTSVSRTKKALSFGGGSQSRVQLNGPMLLLANGEQTRARITVYDQDYAGRALRVEYGLYRLVCTNGLMAFRSVATPIRIPHHKNRTDMLMQLDSIIENSSLVFIKIINEANSLLNLTLNTDWKQVLDKVAVEVSLPKKTVEKVTNLITLNQHRQEDNPSTVWGLYNIINEVERTTARKNSVLYLERDNKLLDAIRVAA